MKMCFDFFLDTFFSCFGDEKRRERGRGTKLNDTDFLVVFFLERGLLFK